MTQSIFLIFFVMVLSSNNLRLFFLSFCLILFPPDSVYSHSESRNHLLRNRLNPYSTSESFLKLHFCSNPKASFTYLENRFVFLMRFLHPDRFFGISLHSLVDFRTAVGITHQESTWHYSCLFFFLTVAERPWILYQK